MLSSKEVKQQANNQHRLHHLQKSRISLAALSQHKPSDLTSKVEPPHPSFIAVNTDELLPRQNENGSIKNRNDIGAFATPERQESGAGGRDIYAPTNSILQVKVSSGTIDHQSSIYSFSSAVSPSVFHIIPEIQRGQSFYHIDHSESSSGALTSGWYTSFGDIDYLWSVIPTTESLQESVKAAVLDTYTDSSLPTILQPRFKAKAPGTALALWVPNIMASVAKRFTDDNPGDLAPGGEKTKDIVRQNIGLLLKKDLISSNWPFKAKQSDEPMYDKQRHRRKVTNHRAKVKHLRRGDNHDQIDEHHSTKTMEKLTWRGPWRKARIKYVKPEDKDDHEDGNFESETYDSTADMSTRRRLGHSQDFGSVESERSSSVELPDDSSVYPDEFNESMVFFNYSNDGLSYTCTLSPIRTLSEADSRPDSRVDSETSEPSASALEWPNDDSNSEDEEELYEESFRLETEHVNCECIKYGRDDHDNFPYLKTLEDIEHKMPNRHHDQPEPLVEVQEEYDYASTSTSSSKNVDHVEKDIDHDKTKSKTKGSSLKRRGSLRRMSSRQRKITDSGRMPKTTSNMSKGTNDEHVDSGIISDDLDSQSMKDMREKIEYMRVASQEDANINAKLYIRIPENVHLCKIQTHLLLCAMRAFFTCNEGVQVRWVKSLHNKIYQLLQRDDAKIKFSYPGDDDDDRDFLLKNHDTVCLLLSHDASILLRDRQSSLLASVADILQINPDNLLVLELENTSPPEKKTKKTKSKKSSSSEVDEGGVFDGVMQTEWFLPVFL